MTKYDLAILGQGSGAFAAAIKADELGVKTAMIGTRKTPGTVLGGTCVNVGCVPSKRLLTVGTLFHEAQYNSFQGIRYSRGRLDFHNVIRQKDELVRKFRRDKYHRVLQRLRNVTFYPGSARFVSKNKIVVGKQVVESRKFVVATGARPSIPNVEGIHKVRYLTNEEALNLKELPRSLCVVGGRTLGLEFAQMYAQFGTKVTVLQRNERILPDDEPIVSEAVTEYLAQDGIRIQTNVTINSVREEADEKVLSYSVNGKNYVTKSEHLLFATGRIPNADDLGLEVAGVETDPKGFVKINSRMETSNEHVWAAGDVTGEPMLETVAAKEGAYAVENAFMPNQRKKTVSYDEVPSAVFTYPEVARVGLTEAQAHQRGIRCSCTTLPFDLVPKAHVIGDTKGLVKVVIEAKTKRVLGVHMVSPHAADLIHEGVLAVKFHLTIDDIIDTVHVFPTLSEATKLAAQSFYRDIGSLSCCTE
jgi:mercuric reductase